MRDTTYDVEELHAAAADGRDDSPSVRPTPIEIVIQVGGKYTSLAIRRQREKESAGDTNGLSGCINRICNLQGPGQGVHGKARIIEKL